MTGLNSLHQGNRTLLLIALLGYFSIVDGGVLKGSVIDGSTQLPVSNALLELYTMDSAVTLRFTGNSKADGSFFYDSIPDRRYFFKLTGVSYASQWYSPKGTTRYMQYGIWIGPASDFITIVLLPVPIDNPPSSVVSVTVRDSSGILVTSGMIQLQNEQDLYTVAIADLNSNQGKVSFGSIQPGRYAVFIQSPPYQPQYYDTLLNTTSPRYYVTIAPYDTVALTVRLTGQPAGNGRLIGKVMAETGQLTPDVFVGLFSSTNIFMPRYQIKTDSAGIFRFDRIQEQPYFLKLGSGSTYPEQWFSPQRHVTTRYPDDPVYPMPTNDTFYITLSANPLDNSPAAVLFVSVLDSMGMAMTSTGTIKCTDRLSTSVKQLFYDPASSGYKIDGLTAGEYSLRIEFPSYPVQYYSPDGATAQALYYQPVTDKDTIVLEVRLRTAFGPVDTTDREIRFDGTVTAFSSAQPIRGARVLAIPANGVPVNDFNPSMLWSSATTLTDTAGHYVIRNLTAGEYFVAALVDSQNFVMQFYQNADRLAGASIVRIDSVNRPTVNFMLRQGGIVTGSIKSAGTPIRGVYVNIHEKNGPRWHGDSTDANGIFKITGLTAGTWSFWMYHPHYLRKDIEMVSPEVTVTEGKVMTVPDITMEPGGRITGAFSAPFSLLDSMNPVNAAQGRFIGNLLLFADSLLTKETINYPRHTAGVAVYCNTADPSKGVFVSDVCPPGTWRAVFQPVSPQGNDTAPPPFKSWLGWHVLGGDTVLDKGILLEIKAFDTVKNITLPLGKGYRILGEMRDSAGAVMNVYNVSAMVKSAGRYFCIAFSERPYPSKFVLSGLNSGHDYYFNLWADGYPAQFWSPETTAIHPLQPWHFDTASFVPLSIRPRRQFADSGTTPDSRPITLSGKFSTSGMLQELSWTIDQKYAFDSCALFARVRDSVTIMAAAVLVQQGVMQFSAAALPASAGPVRYVAVAKGTGVMVRSDEVYYDPRNAGVSADSLWIAVRGTRWNVRIDWGPLPLVQNDSVSLYRRLAGGPWNLIERRPSWNSVLEDHTWDRADSGKTCEYRVELLAAYRASGVAELKLDAQFFANLVKPVYVGPYEKYPTIQSAIDAVESGGMVVVRSGTYRENITFRGKSLFLESDWRFGKPPIIDAGGGIAISAPWRPLLTDDARPHISGFKIVNAATGIQTGIPLYAYQCLFTGVTRAFETIVDSVAMADALRREPFLNSHLDAGLDQCTFVAGGPGSLVAIANARGIAESPGSSIVLPQGYEKAFIMPVYSLGSSVGISNSLIVNYYSAGGCAELPVKLGGTTPKVYVSDGNFWNTATTVSSPRITMNNNILTLDPQFIDTLCYFLPDNSPLRNAASDRRVIGYDGRRFERGGDDDHPTGPTAVKNLSVRILGLKKVRLSWTASPDTEHVVRYIVYRCPGDTSLFYVNQEKQWEPKLPDSLFMTIVDSFSTTACSLIDSNIVPGVPCLYVVAAIDSAGREGAVDLPASTPLAGLIINKYRYQVMLKGQQWHMISPWGADTVKVGESGDMTIYHWDDSRPADKVLSNYVAMNALNPGKGYWFWSERDTVLSVAPATLGLLALREAALSISCSAGRTGWNQIASPLPFPIKPSWLDTVAAWEWRADSLGYTRATVLEPWKAYWVHLTVDRTLALRSDQPALKRASSDLAWRLQLALSGTGAWDPENYVGVALQERNAVAGIDEVLEPPAGFDGSQLYFIKNTGGNQPVEPAATRYSTLFAANTAHCNETMEWRVALSAAQEETRIRIKCIESLPAEYHAFWIDRSRVIDLRKNAAVAVPPHGQEISGYLVVTANLNVVALYSNKLTLNPAWPNPFGKSTNLSYVVPYDWLANGARAPGETRRVRIAIYDIRGRKIATLIDGAIAVGMHRIVWTGDADNGKTAQSGVYIVRMTSNRLHATSRIFKIK